MGVGVAVSVATDVAVSEGMSEGVTVGDGEGDGVALGTLSSGMDRTQGSKAADERLELVAAVEQAGEAIKLA